MKSKYTWLAINKGFLAIGGRPSMNSITLLKSENCSTIVTLLRESEQKIAIAIENKAQSENIAWVWFPLAASALPQGEQIENVRVTFAAIQEKLSNGGRIFIHCAAGIHRTGAFTYGLLRYLGNTAETAKEMIKKLRLITYQEAQEKHWVWGEQFGQEYEHITKQNMEKNCIFCSIAQKKLPASIVFENERVLAIMDIQPINEGHILVMPKKCYHFLYQVPTDLSQELFRVVTEIEKTLWHIEDIVCQGTNILQNNGRSAGQVISHVHFHIIPRFVGDNLKIKYQVKHATRETLHELSNKIKAQLQLGHLSYLNDL